MVQSFRRSKMSFFGPIRLAQSSHSVVVRNFMDVAYQDYLHAHFQVVASGTALLKGDPDPMVAVGTLITERPPHRSRRALLTHRAPPSGRTWGDTRFEPACAPAHSRQSDRRGSSAQCPNHGRLSAVPLG